MVSDTIDTDELYKVKKSKQIDITVSEQRQPVTEGPPNLQSETLDILQENYKVMLGMNFLTP